MSTDPSLTAPDPEDFTDPSPDTEADSQLAILCDCFQERGVTQLRVRYDGSGDSGSVGEIEIDPEGSSLPPWAEEALRDLAEAYCPDGYENNEGGFGTLTIYPDKGLMEREHYDRYVDTETISSEDDRLPEDLQQQLAQQQINLVTASFDGYGDSGQFEDMTVQPENVVLDPALREAVEDFLLTLLPPGWEINEGSFGTFTLDVPTGLVELDGYTRLEQASDALCVRWQWRQ